MSQFNPRIASSGRAHNARIARVIFSPKKSLWVSSHYLLAIIGGIYTVSIDAVLICLLTTVISLCLGYSLGLHRKLIHQSYQCPLWLEYSLVYLGVLAGLAGPLSIIRMHDLRDWAQGQKQCHHYFSSQSKLLKDWFWQLHCNVELQHPPKVILEDSIAHSRFYQWLEKYWMLQQLPLAVVLGFFGGVEWVIWGISIRVAISVTGHWLVGYFAHTQGERHWHITGACVQGHNIKHLGVITMGECWHNNHHAFPRSAKLGLYPGETDPGWWCLTFFERLGWVWGIQQAKNMELHESVQVLAK